MTLATIFDREAPQEVSMARIPMLTETRAAEILRMRPDTLRQWRRKGVGPSYHRFGTAIRYAIADLEAFVAARRVTPGSEQANRTMETSSAVTGRA